jgi:hypothetical protein
MSTAAPSFPFTGRFKKAVVVLEPRRRQRLREAETKIHGYAPERSQHRLGREPVSQIGTIRRVFPAGPDGPLAYFSDFSGGEGGSGGGIFRVVSGQLTLEAIVQGAGTPSMDGKPYSEELYQNQSGLVGLNENVLDPMLALLPQPKPSP